MRICCAIHIILSVVWVIYHSVFYECNLKFRLVGHFCSLLVGVYASGFKNRWYESMQVLSFSGLFTRRWLKGTEIYRVVCVRW